MKIEIVDVRGNWRQVADAARTTIKMDAGTRDPKDEWKKSITRAGHSPIRLIEFVVKVYDVEYWVVGHNVRHKYGIEHFVSSQRDDRTGVPRNELPQGALVDYQFIVNLEELLYICNRRLCSQAHKKTKQFWTNILIHLLNHKDTKDVVTPIKDLFAPMCVKCGGFCPEMKSCGFNKTSKCKLDISNYWN